MEGPEADETGLGKASARCACTTRWPKESLTALVTLRQPKMVGSLSPLWTHSGVPEGCNNPSSLGK